MRTLAVVIWAIASIVLGGLLTLLHEGPLPLPDATVGAPRPPGR